MIETKDVLQGRSQRIGSLLRETADRMRAARAAEKPVPEPAKPPEEVEPALLAKYRDLPPLKLSDEVRIKLGLE